MITIGSHNLHSFRQSSSYHKDCINVHGGIWFGQELWLSEKQIPSLQQLGTQFVARSGMEQAVSDGLLVGRPFGGVSVAWSPNLNHLITPLNNFQHKRVVGVELKTKEKHVLFVSIYMPFFNSSRRAECLAETDDAIAMLDTIIEEHPNHLVVIGGDFNCEFRGDSPFDHPWKQFTLKNNLAFCSSRFPSNSITYRHKSLDQKKWIDHFLVTSSLLDNDLSNFDILDDGDNMSDHFPIVMKMRVNLEPAQPSFRYNSSGKTLKWDKLSTSHLDTYTSKLHNLVDSLPAPEVSLNCNATCFCANKSCLESAQREYDNLLQCLQTADSTLPRQKPGIRKDWWNEDLDNLKKESIDIHNSWKNAGRPRQGPLHEERLRVRAAYKLALKTAQRAPKQALWDRLHMDMAENDTNSFWKTWRRLYNKNKSDLPPVVNGISSNKGIAEAFKSSFEQNSKPNNQERVDALNAKFHSEYATYSQCHNHSCDCNLSNVTVINVIDALLSMKGGKSADADGISVEHLHNAPLNFLIRLASLFNIMLRHSFVPQQFRKGFMIPIIKDQQGNHADLSNYRGITISPIISKVLEHVLKFMYFEFLSTSEFQFGFKRSSSTVHAIHCLRETVTYFINNDSRVYCAFLDASKAFDRLVHSGLFLKLMKRNIPMKFLNIMISWYSGLECRVKWADQYSNWFAITAGVRQGGILSPDFYSIYVDELLIKLKLSGRGCYYLGHFAAALFYADDMAVLSPSIKGLDSLLQICGEYCLEWDICLNAKKSKILYFGKRINISHAICLNGKAIDWVDEWTYLGVTLRSAKSFDCSVKERIRKFFRSTNAIFRIEGKSNDMIMLHLVESHCVPLLTYAIEVIHVCNRDERRQLRVAYNSLFRKIFRYRWSESVSALQTFLGRPTWEQLVESRRNKFIDRVRRAGSSVPSFHFMT